MEAASVDKAVIGLLRFPAFEVLVDEQQRLQRFSKLRKALALGDSQQQKVRIRFDTVQGTRSIETVILAVMDEYIFLQGGCIIPIRVIHELEFVA